VTNKIFFSLSPFVCLCATHIIRA